MRKRRKLEPSDEFEVLVEHGGISFAPADESALTPFGRQIVRTYFTRPKVNWLLGDKLVGKAYCLKLDHPILHYLDVLEGSRQFLFCTENHHSSMHPDDVSVLLMQELYPGLKSQNIRVDGQLRRMALEVLNGPTIIVDDDRV